MEIGWLIQSEQASNIRPRLLQQERSAPAAADSAIMM